LLIKIGELKVMNNSYYVYGSAAGANEVSLMYVASSYEEAEAACDVLCQTWGDEYEFDFDASYS